MKQMLELHRNQYALVEAPSSLDQDATCWNGFELHVGRATQVSMADEHLSILLIGAVFNPRAGDETPADIARSLSRLDGLGQVISSSDHLTGRYALFVCVNGAVSGIPDACAFKRMAYGVVDGRRVITSSERYALDLLGEEPAIEPEVRALLRDPDHLRRQSPWFGSTSADSRFRFVLPNHHLDVRSFQARRTPLPRLPELPSGEKVALAAELLRGTIEAASSRHPLMMALTAGRDSRCLFAASLSVKDHIDYYVFSDAEGDSCAVPDVMVPSRIARDYGVKFSVVPRPPVPREFREVIARQTLIERDVPQLSNVYHHYLHAKPLALNVNGNAAEIFRCTYGVALRQSSLTTEAFAQLGNVRRHPLLVERIDEWRSSAEPFGRANDISTADLFYWEQRMAMWGSQFPLEQDLAVEQLAPFNNRFLITLMLSLPTAWRMAPRYVVARHLISHFDDRLLAYPVNTVSPWDPRQVLRNSGRVITETRLLRFAVARRMART